MRLRLHDRLTIDVVAEPGRSSLIEDACRGLLKRPRSIPPKHFYDARGSALFDRICDLPEYYLTRREEEILSTYACPLVAGSAAEVLVEFGSGASKKTRIILEALLERRRALTSGPGGQVLYIPFDLSEEMLKHSAQALLERYPALEIHGLIADYETDVDRLPPLPGKRGLVAFLGSTIGNFSEDGARSFLGRLARHLPPGTGLLVGFDLVKDPALLNAAYNDSQGVTAAFNKNLLEVLNKALQADFDPSAFDHVAFFESERSRIEMYLRARRPMNVALPVLSASIQLEEGELIHTENSRKFTRESAEGLLRTSGFGPLRWETSSDGWFAVSLSERAPAAPPVNPA